MRQLKGAEVLCRTGFFERQAKMPRFSCIMSVLSLRWSLAGPRKVPYSAWPWQLAGRKGVAAFPAERLQQRFRLTAWTVSAPSATLLLASVTYGVFETGFPLPSGSSGENVASAPCRSSSGG